MPEAEVARVKALLEGRLPEAAPFFERAAKEGQAPTSLGFRAFFASVPRRLGAQATTPLGAAAQLSAARSHWSLVDLARLWLLLKGLSALPADEHAAWLLTLFEAGELGEQVSILRVLCALPLPQRFIEIGEQACRHNSLDVFSAIVSANPFLVEHFPELSFNQAVMKAIFLQVPLSSIEWLERRITPELSRMAKSYVSERRAAGRTVPSDALFLAEFAGAPLEPR